MSTIIEKLVDVTTHLLNLAGGQMNYTKLIKLLYLADREALATLGTTISGDNFVSMKNGPVLSTLYDLIKSPHTSSLWNKYISKHGYDVKLLEVPDCQDLSEMEIEILGNVFEQYKFHDYSNMIDVVHELKEWVNPQASSIPLSVESILVNSGFKDPSAKKIAAEYAAFSALTLSASS